MAAGLAAIDDVMRREMIGLAAASQIGILPAWLGVVLVLGTPLGTSGTDLAERAGSLLANIAAIAVVTAVVLAATGVAKSVDRLRNT